MKWVGPHVSLIRSRGYALLNIRKVLCKVGVYGWLQCDQGWNYCSLNCGGL